MGRYRRLFIRPAPGVLAWSPGSRGLAARRAAGIFPVHLKARPWAVKAPVLFWSVG